jgi:hypothetical protein
LVDAMLNKNPNKRLIDIEEILSQEILKDEFERIKGILEILGDDSKYCLQKKHKAEK